MTDLPPEPERAALVVGATGLVGKELVSQLIEDDDYDVVRVFVRRDMGLHHAKLEQHIINFDRVADWEHHLRGDVLFSAMGTTLKSAGSKEAQYKVDYGYQFAVAEAAARQKVQAYVLVSSTGANPASSNFYLRTKGELERDISLLPFISTRFLRPGMLDGDRVEHRAGEKIGLKLGRLIPKFQSLARVRPIHASIVARVARSSAKDWSPGVEVLQAERLFLLGED